MEKENDGLKVKRKSVQVMMKKVRKEDDSFGDID